MGLPIYGVVFLFSHFEQTPIFAPKLQLLFKWGQRWRIQIAKKKTSSLGHSSSLCTILRDGLTFLGHGGLLCRCITFSKVFSNFQVHAILRKVPLGLKSSSRKLGIQGIYFNFLVPSDAPFSTLYLQLLHTHLTRFQKQAAKMNGRKSRNKKREKPFYTELELWLLLPLILWTEKENSTCCGHKNNRFHATLFLGKRSLIKGKRRQL